MVLRESDPILPKPQSAKPYIRPLDYYLQRLPRYLLWAFAVFVLLSWSSWMVTSDDTLALIADISPASTVPFIIPGHIAKSMGPYSPYHSVEEYKPPPSECSITQVHILQRHGSRYPTDGASTEIRAALEKLMSAPQYLDKRLSFLGDYEYELGTNDLLPYGASESYAAGQIAYDRYHKLVKHSGQMPFVRISDSDRVINSARNWTAGFEATSKLKLGEGIIIPEREGYNNTLDNNQCPRHSHELADKVVKKWAATFANKITQRINELAPGANLHTKNIPPLMSLCSFETLAMQKTSKWCFVFEPDEWPYYEYAADLEKYYYTGYGNPLGPPQGIGYVNELIARLTETPVVDNTQTNSTLDNDPETFPLGRSLYVDFTHDNEMVAIYSAMGLFDDGRRAMDPTNPDPNRLWYISRITPFAARMVVERVTCEYADDEKVDGIRILVNDKVVDLPKCATFIADGICELESFVETQKYATHDGEAEWRKCFATGHS